MVQMTSGTVETDRTNGSSHRRYQGYTTGAHSNDAAIGHANVSGEYSSCRLRSHTEIASPSRTAKPATACGLTVRTSVAKTGSLKRNRCTNTPSDPVGAAPRCKKGTYSSPTIKTANNPSRTRTRRQYSGVNTMGKTSQRRPVRMRRRQSFASVVAALQQRATTARLQGCQRARFEPRT